MTVFVKEKKTNKKKLAEAQFGLVLNWASVTQGSSKTMMIKEINVRDPIKICVNDKQ